MQPLSFRRRQFLRAIAALSITPRISLAGGEPLVIVTAAGSRLRDLSSDKLRRIFLALPTDDDDGHRFLPINLAQGNAAREQFDRRVLNMSPTEASRYWIDQRLRGSKPPRSAGSFDICRRAIQELPGAISYLPASAVGSLKIVTIDGRTPRDHNYALK